MEHVEYQGWCSGENRSIPIMLPVVVVVVVVKLKQLNNEATFFIL